MGLPRIDKDHLMMNISKHFCPNRLGQKVVYLHSLLYINLMIILNCRAGCFLQHYVYNYV